MSTSAWSADGFYPRVAALFGRSAFPAGLFFRRERICARPTIDEEMKIHQPGNQRARGHRAVRSKAFERVLPERFDWYVEFSSASREVGDNLGSPFGRREIDQRIGMLEMQHVVEINENQQAMNEFEFAFRILRASS